MFSCKSDSLSDMKKTELMSHGFPIAMYVPKGAVIQKTDLGVMQDLTIKAEKNYYVQIFSSDLLTLDKKVVMNEKLVEAKSHRYFSKIISEEDDGFIFEKNVDGILNYDFRYVKIQGDKEFVFQTGLVGNYSEDDVKAMYASVK
tara:strand:+ start:1483 stop:1914 length:432 start_codon:yes stop_codon:yes gene_type:complete